VDTNLKKSKQAVILAGGFGTRLGSLTQNLPKPMMDINGIPFAEYILKFLIKNGINNIIFSVGHLKDPIKNYFGDGSKWGVEIKYVVENIPSGTGGFLKLAPELLDEYFFVVNGDTIFDFDIDNLFKLLKSNTNFYAAMAAREVNDVSEFGAITLDKKIVLKFNEKKKSGKGLINGGCYFFKKSKICELASTIPYSIEIDLLPKLVESQNLLAGVFSGFFIDIGLPDKLNDAIKTVPIWWDKYR